MPPKKGEEAPKRVRDNFDVVLGGFPRVKRVEVYMQVYLGRPGNNVKMGIVGLPNVGKSTFFNILCNMSVAAENYPFCTVSDCHTRPHYCRPRITDSLITLQIDPNVSRVAVPVGVTVSVDFGDASIDRPFPCRTNALISWSPSSSQRASCPPC
jgi:hypothetical protein